MRSIFWLQRENRLRAIGRFAGLAFLFAVFFYPLQALLSFLVGSLSQSTGLLQRVADHMAASGQYWVASTAPDYAARLVRSAGQFIYWPFNQPLMVGVCLAAMALAGRFIDRRPFADFGFHFQRRWWADFGFGLFLGAFLMGFIFLFELALGWVTVQTTFPAAVMPFWLVVPLGVLSFIQVGIVEETVMRGYFLRNLAEGLHLGRITPRASLLIAFAISSSLFGLLHLGNDNATWVSTVNLMATGVFLGLGYVLTGELAIPIGIHITWNFFQGYVFGFPVSGSGTATSFLAIQQGGPEAWTGGTFGPEAGLVGILAIALGCALIPLWLRWRYGTVRWHERLALYCRPETTGPAEVTGEGLSEGPDKLPAQIQRVGGS